MSTEAGSKTTRPRPLTAGNWYRVDAPDEGFTCGVRVLECRVVAAGPRLGSIVGWEFGDAVDLFREQGWKMEGPLP